MTMIAHKKSILRKEIAHCLAKAEFYKLKSQAKYARTNVEHYQKWADFFQEIDELLDELIDCREKIRANENQEKETSAAP